MGSISSRNGRIRAGNESVMYEAGVGVFVEDKETGQASFFPLPAPTDEEVEGLLLAVMKRVHALLTKRGLLGDEGLESSGPDALAKLQQEGALVRIPTIVITSSEPS